MKQTVKITLSALFALLLLLSAVSCTEKDAIDTDALWANATYTSDTTLGEGANTVAVEIVAGEKSVTLTVKTDKSTLGEALYERGLVDDPSFCNICNGITADWNADGAYWSFYVNGAIASYGIGNEKAATTLDDAYRLVYSKS